MDKKDDKRWSALKKMYETWKDAHDREKPQMENGEQVSYRAHEMFPKPKFTRITAKEFSASFHDLVPIHSTLTYYRRWLAMDAEAGGRVEISVTRINATRVFVIGAFWEMYEPEIIGHRNISVDQFLQAIFENTPIGNLVQIRPGSSSGSSGKTRIHKLPPSATHSMSARELFRIIVSKTHTLCTPITSFDKKDYWGRYMASEKLPPFNILTSWFPLTENNLLTCFQIMQKETRAHEHAADLAEEEHDRKRMETWEIQRQERQTKKDAFIATHADPETGNILLADKTTWLTPDELCPYCLNAKLTSLFAPYCPACARIQTDQKTNK